MESLILVPALDPDDGLVAMVDELLARSSSAIVVVDDGSAPGAAPVFDALRARPRCTVLAHAENLGKGQALRTGMSCALFGEPAVAGVVTADADGQHAVDDILTVAGILADDPATLVLGVRQFTGEVPARNRLGNLVVRRVLQLLTGRRLSDTQTGLRGIPAGWLPSLIALRSTRYEFEMEMLLWACVTGAAIREVPVRTIYGATSHFGPLRDSARIGVTLARFALAALVSRRARAAAPLGLPSASPSGPVKESQARAPSRETRDGSERPGRLGGPSRPPTYSHAPAAGDHRIRTRQTITPSAGR